MSAHRGSNQPGRNLLLVALVALLVGGCGVLGRSTPPPDRSQDPRIREEVEARLSSEPALEASAIRVEVDGGVVVLHGSVRGIGAWQCAVTTAGLVRGVRTVSDYLVIERGPRDVGCVAPRPDTAVVRRGP